MRHCFCGIVYLGSLLSLFVMNVEVEGDSLRTVALSGQPAPGTPSGVVYRFLNSPPTLNAAGYIAYDGHLTSNGTHLGEAIWSEGSGSAQLLAREGEQAPGMPSGVNFSTFAGPVLNSHGQSSVFAIAREGDQIFSGAWTDRSGSFELVAAEGMQAPGTPPGVVFDGLINGRVLLNDNGHIAFNSFLEGSGVHSENDIGIWSDSTGSLELVAREGDQAPGVPSGVRFDALSLPLLNAAGQLAFSGSITGSGSPITHDGIWTGRPGELQLIARNGDHAPGTTSGVNFRSFGPPALNSAGQTAFLGILAGDVTSGNDRGIWSQGSGDLELVARTASPAPGTPSGVHFSGMGSPELNAAGDVVFVATVAGSEVDTTNSSGIWTGNSNELSLAVRSGSQAPGTPVGANFGNLTTPAMNAEGQIAFLAGLFVPFVDRNGVVIGGPGGGVTASNDFGLWATDRNGILRLIAREGDLLEVAPSDFRTINNLAFLVGGVNHAGASGFNDRGQVAFLATFADGSSGLFVSNLVAVPEPDTRLLFCFVAVAIGMFRPRQVRKCFQCSAGKS